MILQTFWFITVAFAFAMYVVLDGFDLGAGALHFWAARTTEERKKVFQSIGPVWDGNEVWLLAAAGTLYFAFPAVYASGFSGFYLALMIILWLLILRGISIEFRNHLSHPVWTPFWDVVFSFSSLLLILCFGLAIGNIIRGVPLNSDGWFFLPLWTNFRLGVTPGLIDCYTLATALTALLALTYHGALWLVLKNEGALAEQTRRAASQLWWGVLATGFLVTAFTYLIQPQVSSNIAAHPWGILLPLTALIGLGCSKANLAHRQDLRAFFGSCLYLLAMIGAAAFGVYPSLLPAVSDPALSLTIQNSAAPEYGLRVGLWWWIPGMILTTIYFVMLYRRFAGKIGERR